MIEVVSQNVDIPALDLRRVEKWVEAVAGRHDRRLGPLTYIFCDDTRILEVNLQYLNHDYFTDIITFDYTNGKLIRGDMFISLDTVATNAAAVGSTYEEELMRVIIHGVLHLCGINDKGPGEREIMEAHENDALSLWREAFAE